MARTMPFAVTNLAANNVTPSDATVANSRFNPVQQTSRVSVYAVCNAVNSANISVSLGSEVHADDVPIPFDTNVSLSTRDHLVATGVALRGQKITVGYRETAGVATTDLQGLVVIEPL